MTNLRFRLLLLESANETAIRRTSDVILNQKEFTLSYKKGIIYTCSRSINFNLTCKTIYPGSLQGVRSAGSNLQLLGL